MSDTVGWHFPPTGGGQESGWRDPGLAHFRGAPIRSLARETIQNSLDARNPASSADQPVHVSFELHAFAQHNLPSIDEWRAALTACQAEADDERTVQEEIREAIHLLEQSEMRFLRVADWNTTGLGSDEWQALVKSHGRTVKPPGMPGGSHGAGKFAAYAVSPLRTVFYWTRTPDGANTTIEQFQGRALLMTHNSTRHGQTGRTQGVGYYGVIDDCLPIGADDMPEPIRRVEHSGERGFGTSLWIAGFPRREQWRRELASTVIESFFPAIARGELEVIIDDDGQSSELPNELDISAHNLSIWFERLLELEPPLDEDADMSRLAFARECWQMMQSGVEPYVVEDRDFGTCRVWVRFSPGLPQQVAVVRATGMVITTNQAGLKLRGVDDFAAICVFDSQNGNELLRRMENPTHDQFEVDWLPEEERPQRARDLSRMLGKLRQSVRARMPERPKNPTVELSELAELLPDLEEGDEELGGRIGAQHEGTRLVKRKPPRPPRPPRPRPPKIGYIALHEQRVDPIAPQRAQIAFTPAEGGRVKIELNEVGDTDAIEREVNAYDLAGHPITLDDFELIADERTRFQFERDDDVTRRAWRVAARKLDPT